MNFSIIPLLAGQAAATGVPASGIAGRAMESDVVAMVANAGPMVKAIMIILLAASVVSWWIILLKLLQFHRANRNSATFLDNFWKSRSLASLYSEAADFGPSPVSQVFRVGYLELGRVHKAKLETRSAIENVERALRRSASSESTKLFKYLPFLASCGNATPFIGLFGTVWGIMGSFHEIGLKGSANLANVAPGISEALVATAAGLAAAIPAVVFYNWYNSRLRVLETDIHNFMADFVNILERDLLKKSAGQGA
ncbi:MAG: protein TolQ [Deltaproteobacteria bacterium]|jgi:biopolymer transport protein TolQ|nr:protein TolQ [Deltaproteobacteria bacterium]